MALNNLIAALRANSEKVAAPGKAREAERQLEIEHVRSEALRARNEERASWNVRFTGDSVKRGMSSSFNACS